MESKWIAFLLVVSGIVGCASPRVKDQKATFFVRNADAMQPECVQVDYREAALACHRISVGEHVVLAVREYSDLGLDQERFRKITFVLDSALRSGDVVDLSNGGARAFYSTGLSFMPGKAGCYGESSSGTVEIRGADEESLELKINVTFNLESPTDWPGACQTRDYRSEIVAGRRLFENLGPWEGVRGKGHSLIAESVPDLYPVNAKP